MLLNPNNNIIRYLISLVWLVNGLFCKVLNQVPRHEEIVSRILGTTYSRELTVLIGFSEIMMVVWILSRFKTKLNAVVQIVIVLTMNFIEFIFAKDLLLWGSFNAVFAIVFVSIVYYNEFVMNKK